MANSADDQEKSEDKVAKLASDLLDSPNKASFEDLWESVKEQELPREHRENADIQLVVDVAGFEGPLDLLLDLARRQKVDLAAISILALAEQYLEFVEEVRRLRIELAADYLVMAAWLAYLKSRLLLPEKDSGEEEPSGEELAAQLAHRLRRLEAMREAGRQLVNRNCLGRDFFARGAPEAVVVERKHTYSSSLYELLTTYAAQRQRQGVSHVTIASREVWSLADARDLLVRLVGKLGNWAPLDSFILSFLDKPELRASAIASSFAASLELAREGKLEIRQDHAFGPLLIRAPSAASAR